ncbi:MAG: DUF1778 domain-containing protein, partial [Coriobacteriales bacterium]|nr:DUF1778 domain-containing protein [Coriobacteriales bacterium]
TPGRLGGRMEIRLDEARKNRYEEAASLNGQTLTQWTIANLDVAADRTFEQARVTRLAREDFRAFCELLDQPMPQAARRLLEEDPQWA